MYGVASGASEAGNNAQPRTTTTTNEDPERLVQCATDLCRSVKKTHTHTQEHSAQSAHTEALPAPVSAMRWIVKQQPG